MIPRWAVLLLAVAACQSLPYREDAGYLVSAQANSPEFPVKINGAWCVDMDGLPGACSKRIKSTDDVHFTVDPMPYSYLLQVSCTSGVRPVEPVNVQPGRPLDLVLEAGAFSDFRSFTCIGEVSPQDRNPPISAKFKVSLTVYDAQYAPRERISVTREGGKSYLVLGQFARSAWVYDAGAWTPYSRATVVELRGDPAQARGYSESYAMRYNFLGIR